MEWDQIVRQLGVSSNDQQAYRLIDGMQTTFWQSSGTQGKVISGRGMFSNTLEYCNIQNNFLSTG